MQATFLKKFAYFFFTPNTYEIYPYCISIKQKNFYKTLTISRLYLQKSNIIRIFNLPTLQKKALKFCTLNQTCVPKFSHKTSNKQSLSKFINIL